MFDNTDAILDHAETRAFEDGFELDACDIAENEAERAFAARTEQCEMLVTVSNRAYGQFVKKVEDFAKIAARHGQVVAVVSETRRVIERTLYHGLPAKFVVFDFVVSIPPFVGVKGSILGHFERTEDGQTHYTHIFNEERAAEVEAFAPRMGECDHCGMLRQRNNCFVCTDGETTRIIGSTCLKDYLGIDPAGAIKCAAIVKELSQSEDAWDDCFFGGGSPLWGIEEVVQQAYRVGKMNGGYSVDTKERLRAEFEVLMKGGSSKDAIEIKARYKDFNPACDMQALADYVEHAGGEFGANLRTAFEQLRVGEKRFGLILAGVCMMVGRTMKRAADAEKAKDLPTAKHVDAPIGKRVDLVGNVVSTRPYESMYGMGVAITVRCDGGENLLHFCTGENTPDAGQRVKVRATIKKHQTDKRSGELQTLVSRAIYTEIKD